MEGSPLIAVPNGVSRILRSKPIIAPFESSNEAQHTGEIVAVAASVIIPQPGGKGLAIQRGLSAVERRVLARAKNILADQLDLPTLQAAAREAAGEVVARKTSGVAYDHIPKVKEALKGLMNADKKLSNALRDGTLTNAARAIIKRNLKEIRTAVKQTQQFIKDHNIN